MEQDTSKKEQLTIGDLIFEIDVYGKNYYPTTNSITNTLIYNQINNYRITVTPINKAEEEMSGGILKYKKTTNEKWEIANNLEFVISDLTQYDIIYEDNYKNSISATIEVYINNVNGQIMITEK